MTVGFIGFGEAASSIALGLHDEGVTDILCYDAMQEDSRYRDRIEEKIHACGGTKEGNPGDVCRKAEVVISAVPSDRAVSAAEAAAEGIREGLLFLDVSTASPAEKRTIGAMVEEKGALFIDGAMLGALLRDKHRVPMLLSGKGAQALKEKMDPYHMKLEIVEGEPGTATSIKFIRSITAKGLSCLLIESLRAAQKFGVEQLIVDSFLDSYGADFIRIIDGYVSGAILHAERREHEMQNVVDFLKSESLPCTMAEAARQELERLSDERVKDRFEGGVPREWRKVLDGWNL